MLNEELLKKAQKKITEKYLLINILTKRIHELHQGRESALENVEDLSVTDISLKEILEGKLRVKEKEKAKKR